MIALLSFLCVLVVSVVVTKVATVALSHTGLSRESARFQARSAFTGVGFTTREAERVVSHPVRRRIVMLLMLLGNAGIVSAVSSLILTFVRPEADSPGWPLRVLILGGAIAALWALASSATLDRWLARGVGWGLRRWTRLDTRDYASLLHLADDYQVQELEVEAHDWLADRDLQELALAEEGVLVLGVQRSDGRYVGAPTRSTRIRAGDVLLLYGRDAALCELDERRSGASGDREHDEAVSEQQGVVARQEAEEKRSRRERE